MLVLDYLNSQEVLKEQLKYYRERYWVDEQTIEHVVKIIVQMSFKNSLEKGTKFTSNELQIVQDADRLDAIGAIGIALIAFIAFGRATAFAWALVSGPE